MPSSDASVFNIFIFRTQMSSEADQLVAESKPSAEELRELRATCKKTAKQILDEYYADVHGNGAEDYAVVVTQLVLGLTTGGLKPQPQPLPSGQHQMQLRGALPALPLEVVSGLWKQQTKRESTPASSPVRANLVVPCAPARKTTRKDWPRDPPQDDSNTLMAFLSIPRV
jgi:hypothetical protein